MSKEQYIAGIANDIQQVVLTPSFRNLVSDSGTTCWMSLAMPAMYCSLLISPPPPASPVCIAIIPFHMSFTALDRKVISAFGCIPNTGGGWMIGMALIFSTKEEWS